MIPGGKPVTRALRDEDAMLRHQRQIDAHRTAQAILKRRHAANVALARIARASRLPEHIEDGE